MQEQEQNVTEKRAHQFLQRRSPDWLSWNQQTCSSWLTDFELPIDHQLKGNPGNWTSHPAHHHCNPLNKVWKFSIWICYWKHDSYSIWTTSVHKVLIQEVTHFPIHTKDRTFSYSSTFKTDVTESTHSQNMKAESDIIRLVVYSTQDFLISLTMISF